MSQPRRVRYEPLPAPQPPCTACWAEGAQWRVWEGRTWVATYCTACAEAHLQLRHLGRLDFWEEDAP